MTYSNYIGEVPNSIAYTNMAAIRRHLPLITARVKFSEEVTTGHPRATHAIDFGYIKQKRASSPVLRRSPSVPPTDDTIDTGSDTGLSPSWIDYDDEDVAMVGAVDDREEHAGNRDGAGPSTIPPTKRSLGKKIPKPVGEAGRPNCGGYNLEKKLKWKKEDFEEIKVRSSL